MVEYENGFLQGIQFKKDKLEKENATVEIIRKKACEKLGETKKRHKLEDTPGLCKNRKRQNFLKADDMKNTTLAVKEDDKTDVQYVVKCGDETSKKSQEK